ncbi:DUF2834 domain-containing protein [Nocardioides sp. WV_118_6]
MTSPLRFSAFEVFLAAAAVTGLGAVGALAVQVDGTALLSDAFATPASTMLTIDLLVLGVSVVVWTVVEARRLGLRRPWVWAALAIPLPGAFVVPLFLLVRERRLRGGHELSAVCEQPFRSPQTPT